MTSPLPATPRRIRTGGRSDRVSIGISPAQRAEAERLAASSHPPLTLSSYLYELLSAALVNDAERAAEEEGGRATSGRRAPRRTT